MAAGDLTNSAYLGRGKIGTAALLALITGANLPAATDEIQLVPTGAPGEVAVFKIVRAAA